MKKIPLTKGKFALVDDADFEWLNQWKWYAFLNHHMWYAQRSIYKGRKQYAKVLMHREILGLHKGDVGVDHINGDGLDNRRQNLRTATVQQNAFNQKLYVTSTSGFTGVTWNKKTRRWRAYITINQHKILLGSFIDKNDAVTARNIGAKQYFGEFARSTI